MKDKYFVSGYERDLFHERYQDPGNREFELTWEDLFDRICNIVSKNGEEAGDFYEAMSRGEFIPSSPQLWNYGASRRFPRNGSSCFTGKMGDTLKDFRQADSDAEDVYVASGGFGLLLDDVRPRGTKIRHCSEGAMGSMCEGGPALRIESTTGYITGSGRARGALMLQQSIWHPDVIEFILMKRPQSLGWLDDWSANARAVMGEAAAETATNWLIERFSSKWVMHKDWPSRQEVVDDAMQACGYETDGTLDEMLRYGVIAVNQIGRLAPQVTEWNTGMRREANRDWELPLQNCNMSVRIPDCFYEAVQEDLPWVFHWTSPTPPKDGQVSWTLTDAVDGRMNEYEDGTVFAVSDDMTLVERMESSEYDGLDYRYAIVVTTWEGLRERLAPNKNQWRDTKYSRFYRTRLLPAIENLSGTIMAKQVWEILVDNAWNHADPGIVNSDTYEDYQPVDSGVYGPRLSNPCSEYVNSGGGSCNLASPNLRSAAMAADDVLEMMKTSPSFMEEGISDWTSLRDGVAFSKYLDEVGRIATVAMEYISKAFEHNQAPVKYIDEMTREHFRTVGVGFMGLAEALMKFHVRYGTQCAANFTATSMSEIALSCWVVSFNNAKDGSPKPLGWCSDRMERIFRMRAESAKEWGLPDSHIIRWTALADKVAAGEYATNTTVSSVAPTGSISQIAGWQMSRLLNKNTTVTSGVEPPFFWGVARQDSSGSDSQYHDLWYTDEHNEKPWMVTANELPAREHILMQAAACAFCCMSVSKTVNVKMVASKKDISDAYMSAWEMGVPGTSVYRDNSKPMQVLSALECPSGECAIDFSDVEHENSVGVAK